MSPECSANDNVAAGDEFNKRLYRCRHIIENLIGWIKENRRIFTRYEKTTRNFAGMIKWAFLLQYLRYDVKSGL